MARGDGTGLAPFAYGLGGDPGEAGGRFRAAEAINDVVDGDWHGETVAEVISAAKNGGDASGN
jgi:hypothetical protein